MSDTTEDGFLGHRLRVKQPKRGYRAGMDPVLLAASVDAKPRDRVLELGCGVGVVLLCLKHRIAGINATGVEVQPELADLARGNATANGVDLRVFTADLADLPAELRAESFDHVLANPPFFDRTRGSVAQNASRETGRGEAVDLAVWVDVAVKRLAPNGRLWMIQRAARLPDLLSAFDTRLGDIQVLPIAGRQAKDPETIIVSARKGARGEFRLLQPLISHAGSSHQDGDQYTPTFRAVLEEGARLPFKDSE